MTTIAENKLGLMEIENFKIILDSLMTECECSILDKDTISVCEFLEDGTVFEITATTGTHRVLEFFLKDEDGIRSLFVNHEGVYYPYSEESFWRTLFER